MQGIINLTYRIKQKTGAVKRRRRGKGENMIANIIIVMLGLGCAFLAVGLWIDRLLNRPIERRWR